MTNYLTAIVRRPRPSQSDSRDPADSVLVFFPEDEHNPGNIACIEFSNISGDSPIRYSYGEAALGFYHKTKPVSSADFPEVSTRVRTLLKKE